MGIRRRGHIDAAEPVAQLLGCWQLHGQLDGHGQPRRGELAGLADCDGLSTAATAATATAATATTATTAAEPAAGRDVHVQLHRPGLQLHEHEY